MVTGAEVLGEPDRPTRRRGAVLRGWLNCAIRMPGRYMSEDAKMTGMTPAMFTLIGMYVLLPPRCAARPALGVLHRDAALRLLDEHHGHDGQQPDDQHDAEDPPALGGPDLAQARPGSWRRWTGRSAATCRCRRRAR